MQTVGGKKYSRLQTILLQSIGERKYSELKTAGGKEYNRLQIILLTVYTADRTTAKYWRKGI